MSPKQQDGCGDMYDCLLASTGGWTIVQPLHSLNAAHAGRMCVDGVVGAPARVRRHDASRRKRQHTCFYSLGLSEARRASRSRVQPTRPETDESSRMLPTPYLLLLARWRVEQVEQGERASRSSRTPPAAYSLLLAGVLRPGQRVE